MSSNVIAWPGSPEHTRQYADAQAAELARLRAIESAAYALIAAVEHRAARGWTKTPMHDVRRLRAALED